MGRRGGRGATWGQATPGWATSGRISTPAVAAADADWGAGGVGDLAVVDDRVLALGTNDAFVSVWTADLGAVLAAGGWKQRWRTRIAVSGGNTTSQNLRTFRAVRWPSEVGAHSAIYGYFIDIDFNGHTYVPT